MDDENFKKGCVSIFLLTLYLAIGFIFGLETLKDANGQHLWWHYLIALPVGLLSMLIASGFIFIVKHGFIFVVKWLPIPDEF